MHVPRTCLYAVQVGEGTKRRGSGGSRASYFECTEERGEV